MSEEYYMEDENEWPYLVWEKKDRHRPSKPSNDYENHANNEKQTDEQKIHSILDSMDLSYSKHMKLYNKIISFLNAKDCTCLNVTGGYDEYSLVFTRENKYIKTIDEFLYYPILGDLNRVFKDCYTTHNHDNLLKDSRFQDLIRNTGFKFIECNGGYVTKYSIPGDEFTLEDEIDIGVYFKVGSTKRRYKLDLDKMKLSKDYFEY